MWFQCVLFCWCLFFFFNIYSICSFLNTNHKTYFWRLFFFYTRLTRLYPLQISLVFLPPKIYSLLHMPQMRNFCAHFKWDLLITLWWSLAWLQPRTLLGIHNVIPEFVPIQLHYTFQGIPGTLAVTPVSPFHSRTRCVPVLKRCVLTMWVLAAK